ncbi:MAG: preprotein translocase subunit YajC [Wolbachia endosymbiont of Meromenopon meropis]|nr:preprotein translocase subunit YajC [Wolbachia endosymbiont of Meromenopon meropis]
MFTSEVFASDAANNVPNISASFANFIPLILIIVVFYFFIIRPHQKKIKELRRMIDQIKCGDVIVTSGGIIGIVNKFDEANAQFVIEVAPKVEIKILKSAISEVLSKKNHIQSIERSDMQKQDKKNKNHSNKSKSI